MTAGHLLGVEPPVGAAANLERYFLVLIVVSANVHGEAVRGYEDKRFGLRFACLAFCYASLLHEPEFPELSPNLDKIALCLGHIYGCEAVLELFLICPGLLDLCRKRVRRTFQLCVAVEILL